MASPARSDQRRNGYRHREFDTRAGTLEVAIPKLREGSYFPDWLLERRRRAERALTTVVATCYLLGVSTRRMEKLVDALGITRLSKSQVSVMAARARRHGGRVPRPPARSGPYTFVAADALALKVREGGRVVNVHALVATGVNADGHREILGLQVTSAEDGAGWLAFFRGPDRPRPDRRPAGHLRCPHRAGRRDRRDAARRGVAALIRQHQRWREGPAGSPPPPGEDLGSVTFEVQRQTCPSRRWRILDRPVGVVPRAPG